MWILGLSTALAITVAEVPNPRASGHWVSDVVDVLHPREEEALEAKLDLLEAETGAEVTVVTVDSVSGSPHAFAVELFNTWGVGKASENNGLVVLLVMDARRLEMVTGDGLRDVLTEGKLKQIQVTEMVPAFKQGDFGGGLVSGVVACGESIRAASASKSDSTAASTVAGSAATPASPETPEPAHTPEASQAPAAPRIEPWPRIPWSTRRSATDAQGWTRLGFFGGLGIVVLTAGWFWRRERRTCPTCRVHMPKLDDYAEDAYLTDGQIVEERIWSRFYNVHLCPSCEHVRTFQWSLFGFGYSNCPQCNHLTRSTKRTTVDHPTTTSTGRQRLDDHCEHCGYTNTRYRTLAKLERSSESTRSRASSGFSIGSSSSSSSSSYSSSSSRGSFGGGSSSGGGAGSSW